MESKVYELLENLNINYEVVEHPPLFSRSDNEKYNIKIDAVVCKNLFLTNSKKSNYYLCSLPLNKKANLKLLQIILGEKRLSFVNEELLEEMLGVKSGSVSIFNVINVEKNRVIFLLDEELLQYEKIGFHPNVNTKTVIFNSKELTKILNYYNVEYKFIKV